MRVMSNAPLCSGACRGIMLRPSALTNLRAWHSSAQAAIDSSSSVGGCPTSSCTGAREQLGGCCAQPNSRRCIATSAAATMVKKSPPRLSDYDASQIQVLEGLDPVRKRPGMYIGSTGQRGLHHLVYEILDNAIDEVQAGHATHIQVLIDPKSGWVEISDNGRGIPTDLHPATGKSALETVLTVLHAGGKFGGGASGYKISGGLHGVGISVVNALSSQLDATVYRQDKVYRQSFVRGVATAPLEPSPATAEDRAKGTTIRFLPDREVFSSGVVFDPDTIRTRLREVAFLNSSATITYAVGPPGVHSSGNGAPVSSNGAKASKAARGKGASAPAAAVGDGVKGEETFHFEGGIAEFVLYNNRARQPMHDPIFISRTISGVHVELALQWTSDSFSDSMVGFVNSIKTVDGGTHMEGFKSSLTRTVNALARKLKILKEEQPNLSGDHIREGLGLVISVKVPEPEFEGQTKTRLGNPEVRKIVETIVTQDVAAELEMDTGAFQKILGKALAAARAAEAAKKARDLVRRKSVLTKSTLPGKLSDCTSSNLAESEIFLVEGDSAGGSAKMARDRQFQAILPLRGKILNVERGDDEKMYANNEISNLIIGLGLGLKGDSIKSLRYGKVIILTDADVDGAHIRTLLLTFLFRFSRELFEAGHVYVGVPPLYKVETGSKKKPVYCYDEGQLAATTADLAPGSYTIQRFKGLGEMMPGQLWDTTMDPSKRTLKRLTVEDAAEASAVFSLLMGHQVAPRRQFIEDNSNKTMNLDI
eukprot:CAMPEP_0206138648 /NCGR_PEP_ID=MMETSP1473-20131121/3463_1 /ASSEMBLY_ACC=CAM_ASM_001109 /TAXON_ID=1461547 /ORGANISM="Stichococcus sp, Strain RCC1054" /LENGTH=763 /DNA_ID=CAMNT_0053532137 /DNA_START=195 /DNA_END=2486 /DNA_ORIENTATION=+